jgi:alkylhydroperoxidase family enzyme
VSDTRLDRRPDLAEALAAYRAAIRSGPLDEALLDQCEALVRGRIAHEAAPRERPADERARAVLELADQFVIDAHGIDDAMRDAVLDHLSSVELAALVQWLAVSDGLARLDAVLADPDEDR